MRRFIPSPAMLVACLALVLSTGGVTYAAAKISTRDIANDAIISVKVKDGSIQPADLGPAVARAMQVRAWTSVVVSPAMSIDTTRSKGFATVTRPSTGIYCLTLTDDTIDASTVAPVVAVDWDNSSGNNLSAFVSKSAHDCPAGTDLGVRTYSFKAGKANTLSNIVAFTVLVP